LRQRLNSCAISAASPGYASSACIEALLVEFDYEVDTSLMCRMMRALCYYVEDIECTDGCHDQAACTRDAFITRYLTRPHGCRDPRPEYQKRYL
jgi:hypothetical protein